MRILSRRNDGKENRGVFRPQITSLIDVMTILLIFLIQNFAVDSDVVSPPPNVDLPLSSSDKPARARCAITITKNEIIADDKTVANIEDIMRSSELVIEPLHEVLQSIRPLCLVDDVGSVVILADRDVHFEVVKKVMATSSRAGIVDYSILVLQEGY